MFGKLVNFAKTTLSEISEGLQDEYKKLANGDFLESSVAVGFLISAADGSIDPDEIKKLRGFIDRSPELGVFDTTKVSEIFAKIRSEYEFDVDMGNDMAYEMVRKSAGDSARGQALMRLVAVIGRADGDFDDDEKAVGRKIASELGVQAEF